MITGPDAFNRRFDNPATVHVTRILGSALLLLSGAASATTTINHLFSPATIDPGDTPSYRIEIANDALVPLTAAAVTSRLPAVISIANPANITDTCGFSAITATPGTSDLVLTGGDIPASNGIVDGQCFIELSVTSLTPGNHQVQIPANTTPDPTTAGYSALEAGNPVSNNTPAVATLAVGTLIAPTGSKTFNPSPAVAGDSTTLNIVLTNPNNSATLPLTSFTDNLPAGMVVATPANASVVCTGTGASNGSVTATPGDGSVTLSGGVIGEAGTCTVMADVSVATVSGTSEVFSNSIPADAIGNTRGLVSAGFSRDLTVESPIDVSKSFSPDTIPAGQPTLLTIVIDNNSTQNPLPITSFIDDLIASTLSVVDSANGAPADPSVACDGVGAVNGTLSDAANNALDHGDTAIKLSGAVAGPRSGGNGKCTISAYVTSTTDGTHSNTIPADAVVNPGNHASPTASDNVSVNAQLTIDKAVSVNSVAPGQSTQFSVTINNWSGGDVTNVSFKDSLPIAGGNQMVLDDTLGVPVSSVGCVGGVFAGNDGDAELNWTGGTVVGGVGASPGVCTIVFRARLPGAATSGLTFTNQIPTWDGVNGVGGDGNGPGGQVVNPSPSPAVNVSVADSLSVTKDFSPTAVAEGQNSLLRIRIRNRVQNPVNTIDLTDNLPAGIVLAANPAATNGCGGSLQAFPGDSQVVLTGGSIDARPDNSLQSTCTITVQVTGDTPGDFTNTINPANFSTSAGTIPSPVSANLTINAGISGDKRFEPTATTSGGRSRVTINIANDSSGELTNIAVDDNGFSAGLAIANPANATSSCGGSPSIVANPGATRAQILGINLPAAANCDFSFDVVTSGAGPWSNTIAPGNISSAEGAGNDTAISANLTASTADIGINKSFNPIIVTGGQPSVLTIDVINSSGTTMTGVSLTDVFPDGIVIFPVPDASTNCVGGTVSAVPGDDKVGLVGATLLANDTCQVFVTTTSLRYLNITNFIPAGVINSDQGYTNALDTQATLSTLQGLGVNKGFSPAYIASGDTSRLVIQLVSSFNPNSTSPVTMTGVSFTDPLPVGVEIATVPNATTSCADGVINVDTINDTITLTEATLPPGSNCLVEVDVTSAANGVYSNLIAEQAVTTDQGISNLFPAEADLHVIDQPTLVKAFTPAQVMVGERTTLTVTLTNNSTEDLTGLSVTDTLPTGMAVYPTPAAATTCPNGSVDALPGASNVTLSGATLPASGSCTLSVDVMASAAGTLTNTIGAGAISTDQGISNPAPGNADLDISAPPTVSKTFTPAAIGIDATSTLTVNLGNANSDPITLTTELVDALPGNVVVAADPNIGGTCPGTVTANPDAIQVSYANGATIPAGGCQFTVDVTSSVGGGYVNTIAAGQLVTSSGNNADPAIATLGVGGTLAAPTVEKAFSPTTIDTSANATLTITLQNPNATSLTLDADFIDTLPGNLVIAAPPGLAGSCALGSVTAIAGSDSVTYASGAQIPAGECSISVEVTSAVAGSYNNNIPAGALSTTTGGTNPSPASAGIVVMDPIPPTLGKAISPNTINPGAVARLTLTLGNLNATDATLTADLVDTLPMNIEIDATPDITKTCPGAVTTTASSITYTSGSVIPAGGCEIAVDITSSISGGPWSNSVAAGSLQTDLGINGASANADLFVNPPQPPSISKQFSPVNLVSGGTSTLSISFGNPNAAPTTLTTDLVDTLPAGVVIAALPNIQASAGCDLASITAVPGGAAVTYASGGTIPADGGCSIAVDVTSTSIGSHTNQIASGALQTALGNNTVGTQSVLNVSPIPPGVTKNFSPAAISAGGTATLTLVLGNNNAVVAALSAALVDNLPADLVVAPVPNIATTAGCNIGDVVAAPGDTSIVYNNGSPIPVGGCSISVDVTAATAGIYDNMIPAGGLSTDLGSNQSPASARLRVNPEAISIPVMPHWGLVLLAAILLLTAYARMPGRT